MTAPDSLNRIRGARSSWLRSSLLRVNAHRRSASRSLAQPQGLLLLRACFGRLRGRRGRRFGRLGGAADAGAELVGRWRIVEPPATEVGQRQRDLPPLGVPFFLQRRKILT